MRVFENRVLRRIFGPKRDEVTGGWIFQWKKRSMCTTFYFLISRLVHEVLVRRLGGIYADFLPGIYQDRIFIINKKFHYIISVYSNINTV
jgi:hypothetical protein